jgi:CO/xanthine dehydrogenase Mo-binding subunit
MQNISDPVKRFDFNEKIDGSAKYCADIKYDDMLYARTLRSERARANIISIEIPLLPIGYYIVDHHDIPGRNIVPIVYEDQPFFAVDTVNYIGEPILLVIGPDKSAILEIIKGIQVKYEDLVPIQSIDEAIQRKDDFIFGEQPCFAEYEYTKGDLDTAIGKAKLVVEDEFRTGYQEHAYMETQGVVGFYTDQRVTVYGSMQCPYYIKEALLQASGWPEDRVRVVQLPTGGGFGGKEEIPSLLGVHAALAAIKTGKPVQLVYERHEDIMSSSKRHPAIINIKSYIDAQDNIIGRDIDIKIDGGAYAGLSSVVLQRCMFSAGGVYNVPNIKVRGGAYATNNVVSGAFRGFGGPQAFFAIEMHIENIAQKLNMDSLELKRKHFLHQGDTSSTRGVFQSAIKLDEITSQIDKMSGYSRKRIQYKIQPQKGIGCSIFFHGCGFTGVGERDIINPRVRLMKYADDTVEIFVSNTEIGQGSQTTLSKIVTQVLEIPVEHVKHSYPDTDTCPDSGPTVASRTVMIVGKLLQDCAVEMKERWHEAKLVIDRHYVYPDNLQWDKEIMCGNAYPEYSWGANVVEVELDPITYTPVITGIWSVFDIGTPIDLKIVQGQIEGGIVQGLGYGGLEVMQVKDGRLQQSSMTDYIIPTALDFPKIENQLIFNPYENGPCGARGLGELVLVGAAPAFALAVQNAIGQKVTRLPVTPEYIMELFENAE